MCKDFDAQLSGSVSSVTEGVRFLIPSCTDTLEFHRALFASLSDSARKNLYKDIAGAPDLAEKVLRHIYRTIDPAGYTEWYGPDGVMLPMNVFKTQAVLTIMEEAASLQKRFPLFVGTRHPVSSEEDNEFLPSIQTVVKSVLSFLSSDTVCEISQCSESLLTRSYTMLAKEHGYEDLADAERALDAAAYDAEFTDGLCSGEG